MKQIHWPAILHYDNEPELEFLDNESAWHQVLTSSDNAFEPQDRLIDSEGQVFSCKELSQAPAVELQSQENIKLETMLGLIKAHLADAGSCCVAKTYAPTIRDAIKILENNQCGID